MLQADGIAPRNSSAAVTDKVLGKRKVKEEDEDAEKEAIKIAEEDEEKEAIEIAEEDEEDMRKEAELEVSWSHITRNLPFGILDFFFARLNYRRLEKHVWIAWLKAST
jgi:hypothetical protein